MHSSNDAADNKPEVLHLPITLSYDYNDKILPGTNNLVALCPLKSGVIDTDAWYK